jgi:hypothetical protein
MPGIAEKLEFLDGFDIIVSMRFSGVVEQV